MSEENHDARPTGPLSKIIVLDLTTFLSGPSATQLLGDLGADVIKLEPLCGDMTRTIPPYSVGPDSAYYLANNRNKRCIAVDLKREAGHRILTSLLDQVDVVVENFRPGVLERLGLDVDAIQAERPALIWVSISGFGQDGPMSRLPAYDMIVQAQSGVMSLTGEPGGPPVRLGIPAGDVVAGLYSVIGLLAALIARKESGRGRWVDAAMLDGQLAMLSYQAVYSMVGNMTPGPQGSRHDSIPTYRTFTGSDSREFAVTANTERMWHALCEAIGVPDLPLDERFHSPARRLANREALWEIVEPRFLSTTAAEWVSILNAKGVPAGLIKTVPEALADARDADRGMVRRMTHADGRTVEVLGSPVMFRNEDPPEFRYPPALGEHSEQVLTELLGYAPEEIRLLTEAGVVVSPNAATDEAQFAEAGNP
ncbi:CaiB/BaiF CoA transferase family protein [Rhodococcoides kyotonense]|uniref:Crotonobetainyl-CoA:carnitine CoA-transferase CaiB n=1 Tax=Rhodococcoides kyotonense TaxID=398843 RepID=A0A239M323_9NOCA|nr:CoA transferase [Rhodococcus kyotonensis]SNT36299.1 Crotonobetainyl-CoA:carnitine CoA-transferase CaiB [Rhodococcus kyotonensis]